MGWIKEDKFYSGQGVVVLGQRDAVTGKPKALEEVGNCSAVKLSVSTNTIDKKESKTGQRALAKRLTTETSVQLSVTMDNYIAKNLARALRGKVTVIPGASIVAEDVALWPGSITALAQLKVSAVAVKQGAVALTPYVNDITPYDYKVNTEAGSIQMNDGSKIALDKAGVVVTAVAVGATTTFTLPNNLVAGDTLGPLSGFTGADAAEVNGKSFLVLSATSSAAIVQLVSTGKVYTAGASSKASFGGMAATVDYTHAAQVRVDALTEAATELYLRFEGLNTADSNEPVVVEVFKFAADPLKDLDLISDGFQEFVLEGPALLDGTRPQGTSGYFQITKLGSALTA